MYFNKICKRHRYIVSLIYLIILIVSFERVSAQEQYILNEGEIPGYQIINLWKIEEYNFISQLWENTENGHQIQIRYIEYENEEVVISGLPSSIGYSAEPMYFGSHTGEIIGNVSYAEEYKPSGTRTLYFQKWNVAIRVFGGILDPTDMSKLGYKIINKIDENIAPEYLTKDQELKMNQITEQEYNQFTEKGIEILSTNNYTEYKTEDTKWGLASDSIVMGTRKQWSTGKSFFAIDIVKLSNKEDAELAGTKRDSTTLSPFCWLNSRESVEQAVTKSAERDNDSKRFVSVTGVIDNYAIHFYYQHQDSVDVDFFKSVLFTFGDYNSAITFNRVKDINVYPNPAKDFIVIETYSEQPEVYILKIFDIKGQQKLVRDITLSGRLQLDISELNKGTYLLTMQNSKTQISRLILVE